MKQVEELTIVNFLHSQPQGQWPKVWYVSTVCSKLSLDVTKIAPSIKALHLDRFPDRNNHRNLIINPQIKALWISGFGWHSSTFTQFTANVQSIAIFVIDLCIIFEDKTFCWDEDEDFISDKEKEEVVRDIPQIQRIQKKIDEMAGLKMLVVIRPFWTVPKSVKFFDTSSTTEELPADSFDLKDLKKMLDDLE